MKNCLLMLALAAGITSFAGTAHASTLVLYPFNNSSDGQSGFSYSTFDSAVLASSSVSKGPGLGVFNVAAESWSGTNQVLNTYPGSPITDATAADAIANNWYFNINLTPNTTMNIGSIEADWSRGGTTGSRGWFVRSSQDSFASNLYSNETPVGTATGLQHVSFDVSGHTGIGATDFRFYIYTSTTGRSMDFQNIQFNSSAPPTLYWLGSAGDSWTAANNWSSNATGTPTGNFTASSEIIFSASTSTNSTATDLGGDLSIASLTINSTNAVGISGGNLTITGSAAVTVSGTSGNVSISAPLILSGSAAPLSIENENTTLASVASANGLVKSGNGTLTLTGNNTNNGTTSINAGTLALSGNGTLGNSTISVAGGTLDMGGKSLINTLGNLTAGTLANGTLTKNGSNYNLQNGTVSATLAGTNGVNKTTSGTVTLSGTNTYNGTTTISAGTLNINSSAAIGTGTLTILGGAIGNTGNTSINLSNLQNWNGDFSFSGPSDLTLGGNVTMNASRVVTVSGGNLTVGGVVAGTGFSLTKNGTGTLTLNGNNTYTGGTFIQSGTLAGNSDGLKGTITNNATLLLGGASPYTYQLNTTGVGALRVIGPVTLLGNATMTGGTTIQSGSLRIGGLLPGAASTDTSAYRAGSITGNISNEGSLIFDQSTANRTYSGVISGNGSLQTIYINYSQGYNGQLFLTNNNTFTGGTFVSVGTVDISGGSLSSTGNVSVSGGVFSIGASNQAIGQLILTGGSATGTGSITAQRYNLQQGSVSLGLAGMTDIEKNTPSSQPISYDNGIVYLSGNNTSGGNITISSGILSLNNVQSLYSGNTTSWTKEKISVSANATLALGTGGGSATSGFNNAQIAVIFNNLTQNGTGGLAANSKIGFNTTSDFTLTANITDRPDGGAIGVDKIGGYTLVLDSNNTFSGGLSIFQGVVALGRDNALLPNSNIVIDSRTSGVASSGFDVGIYTQQFKDVTLKRGLIAGTTGAVSATGNYTMIKGNATANLSGNASLIKTNTSGSSYNVYEPESVFLSGNNSYTGRTIVDGVVWSGSQSPSPSSNSGAPTEDNAKLQFQTVGSLYGGNATLWSSQNISVDSYGIFSLRTGSAGFNATQVSTIIQNLITANRSSTSGGFLDKSMLGIDTNGEDLVIDDAIGDTTGLAIGGGAVGLIKYGSGTLTLNGNSTRSFSTSVTGGNLVLGANATLSSASANLLVDNAMLNIAATNQTVRKVTVTSGSIIGSGTLTSSADGFVFGNATVSANLAGAVGAVIDSSSGTTTLSGNNSFTGNTTIGSSATLSLANVNALAGSTLVFNDITPTANLQFSAGTTTYNLGGLAGTGNLSMGANSLSIGANSQNTTYSAILSGTGSITKVANGTLTLTGENTYTGGTTITGGTLQVNANGRIAHSSSNFTIGSASGDNATLDLTGGNISNTNGIVGNSAGSNGTVNMSGGNWTNSAILYIGRSGAGSLTITNGTISNTYGTVGDDAGSNGTVTVSGGNWTNNDLFIGNRGTGSLTISGGIVTTTSGTLGREGTGSNGTVNVSGGNWTNSGSLQIGSSGTGNLTITGGTVSNTSSVVGFRQFVFSPSGTGTVNVSGGAWTNTGSLSVGKGGNGSLTISGGIVTNTDGDVGSSEGSPFMSASGTGTVNVSGGTWANSGSLTIGNSGNGTLNLTGNGTVTVGGGLLRLAQSSGKTGTLNLGNGTAAGTLSAATITGGSGTAVVNINQSGSYTLGSNMTGSLSLNHIGTGTTTLTGNNTYTGGTFLSSGTVQGNTQNLQGAISNNASVVFNQIANGTYSGAMSGMGTLSKMGNGTLTLNGTSSFGGNVSVNAGTLKLDTSLANADFVLEGGSLVGGNITVGAVTINNGGVIAPGSSPGTLRTGNMTWNGGGIYNWQIANATGTAGTDWDLISSTGGTLTINATNAANDKFVINATPDGDIGFNPSVRSYDWKIASFGGNITGFSNDKFTINATGFGDYQGAFVLSLNATATDLFLKYTTVATWSGGTGNWTDTSNWVDGLAAVNGLEVEYAGTNGTSTNNSGTNSIQSLAFTNNSTGAFTLAGGGLTIGAGGIVNDSAYTNTIALNLALGANQTISANTANLIVSGNISGNASLTKEGNQTLVLSGANTYTGSTTVDNGTLEIAAGGSINNTSDIFVGLLNGDNGTLHINGGSVSNAVGSLGSQFGSVGAAIVSAGNWTNNGSLFVGLGGSGSLTINGTGHVTNEDGYVGHGSDSNGTVTVSGGTWTNNTNLFIGNNGTGSLTINGTGNVTSMFGYVGNLPGGNGTVSVTGGTWTNNLDLSIGNGGTGSLTINGTGHVTNEDGYVGTLPDGNGTVSVRGGTWTNSNSLAIGLGGTGSLTISGTGNVTSMFGNIGSLPGGNGTVSVSGGTWTNSGNLSIGIGGGGTGSLTINGTGTVIVGDTLSRGSNGTINLESGGTLQIGSGGATGTLATDLANSGTLIFNLTGSSEDTHAISGTGTLTKNGTGTLILSGSNTYTGSTTVNAGTLEVNSTLENTVTTVNAGGTLAGIGSLGNVTINSGGAIAPGNSPGTITVGNLTLNGGAIYNWQLGNATGTAGQDWDLISSLGTLGLNATSSNITLSLSTLGNATLTGVKKATWAIGNSTQNITGFNKNAFSIDYNSMNGSDGRYFMSLSNGNKTLLLNYKTAATWNTGNGDWTTLGQWEDNSRPEDGDAVEFTGAGGISTNNFLSGNLSYISGLSFLEGAGAYTVAGNTLEIGQDGIINSSNQTQTIAMDLTSDGLLTVNAESGNITLSGVFSGNWQHNLEKTGNQTLTLTGNNTYEGGTIISAGTLNVASAQALGAIGNITFGGGTLQYTEGITTDYSSRFANQEGQALVIDTYSANNTVIFSSNLTATNGTFTKLGAGALVLRGSNSYTGGTVITGGTLAAQSANAFGTGGVDLNNNGVLAIGSFASGLANMALSVGGNLSWSSNTSTIALLNGASANITGSLSSNGVVGNRTFDVSQYGVVSNNTITLARFADSDILTSGTSTANATFDITFTGLSQSSTVTTTGNFVISDGVLKYLISSAIANGSSLDIRNSDADFIVDSPTTAGTTVVTGQNPLVKDVIFKGSNNLVVPTGVELTVFGQTGTAAGQLEVQNGTSSVVSGSGTIQAPNGLEKVGGGELDLQSNTNVTGIATVVEGLLSVNGQLNANSVVVDPNATLGGAGIIVASNVVVNGNLSPGNSPGTLNVVGNLVLTGANSTIIEIASPTNFDRIVVSGTATLGGKLNAVGYEGYTIAPGSRFDFLQAGSIVGTYDSLIAPDGLRVRLLNSGTVGTLLFGPSSYVPMAINQNQRNVAKALDTFIVATDGDRLAVSIALDSLTTEQFPSAFDQIMPGFYESLANIAIEQAFAQTQMLNQRISSVRLGAAGFQAIGGISQPLVHDKNGKSAAEAKDASPIVESATATNWNAWALGTGMFSRSTNLGSLQNYNNDAGGFLVGADYRWSENFVTGLYGGYDYSYAEYNGGGSTKGNSVNFGTYASYAKDGYYADAVIGGGYTGFQTQRSIEFSTIDRTASADPNSGQFTAGLNLGKDFEVGKFTLGPIVGAQYTYAGIGSFTESGAESLDLSLGQQNANSLRTTLGGRIAYTWNMNQKIALIPEVRMFWQHEFLNNARNINASLNGGNGAAFDFETSDPYRDSVFAGAGVTAQFGKNLSGSVFYNINFGSQTYQSNMVSAGLNFSF